MKKIDNENITDQNTDIAKQTKKMAITVGWNVLASVSFAAVLYYVMTNYVL